MAPLLSPETVGPVDVAVIVFEGNTFNGDVAPALAELQGNGTIRIIDLSFVHKDADGETTFVEVSDADEADRLAALGEGQLDLLNDADLDRIASELEPQSSALVVVWENTWASRVAAAVRDSNGTLAGLVRIPRDVVVEALVALEGEE